MKKDYVLIISFVLTVGSWIGVGLGNADLTAMLALFTVSLLWCCLWLEEKEKEQK